jgi:hypothetical protein
MLRRPRRAVFGGLTVLTAALALAVPSSGVAAGTTNVTCQLDLIALIPQPAPTAANVGSVMCDAPFGIGGQSDNSVTTRTSPLTGSFTGPFTMYFKRGSISGTFTIGFVTTVCCSPLRITGVTYNGTVQVTGGTGDFRNVRGSGTVTGFSPDAKRTHLTEHLALTGV